MLSRLKWLLPAILLFIALVLLSASGRGPGHQSPVTGAVLELASPVENVLTSSARGVENVWRSYFGLVGLRDENEALKSVIARQARQITQLNEFKAENERLTKLLAFRDSTPEYVYVPAKVLAWDPGPWFRSVIIGAGREDGVEVDQAVVHYQGVVGRVVEVAPHYARVLLATDFNSAIDALAQRTRTWGILGGQGDRPLHLKYVRKDDDVRLGDQIVTSGMDGIFPKGLSLGTVSFSNRHSPDMFSDVEVTPTVDFTRLEEVLVVLSKRPRIDWLSLGPSLKPFLDDQPDPGRDGLPWLETGR